MFTVFVYAIFLVLFLAVLLFSLSLLLKSFLWFMKIIKSIGGSHGKKNI